MSLCDTCRQPGACCRGLVLNIPFSSDNWMAEAAEKMARFGLSFFVPVRSVASVDAPDKAMVLFDCTRLGADGRCSDYDGRPTLCRDYEAGSDPLCVEHVYKLCGIPIVVVAS